MSVLDSAETLLVIFLAKPDHPSKREKTITALHTVWMQCAQFLHSPMYALACRCRYAILRASGLLVVSVAQVVGIRFLFRSK